MYNVAHLKDILSEEQFKFVMVLAEVDDLPFLLKKTMETLETSRVTPGLIPETTLIALCNMMRSFWNSCMYVTLDFATFKPLIDYGRVENYYVCISGKEPRPATINEVLNGVRGLQMEYSYPIGEDIYKKLNLLGWCMYGKAYSLRNAGHTVEYDENSGEIKFLDLIEEIGSDLMGLFSWCTVENFSATEKELKKLKRKKKLIDCIEYAEDEIIETMSVKELIFNAEKVIPKRSNDTGFKRAIYLLIRAIKYKTQPAPMEVVFLRETYARALAMPEDTTKDPVVEETRELCEKLIEAREKNLIDGKHFAFKIITTLRGKDYKFCSVKQRKILDDAMIIVRQNSNIEDMKPSENDITPVIEDMDGFMNILGEGGLED